MDRPNESYVKKVPFQKRVGNMKFCASLDGDYFEWNSMSLFYGLVDGVGVIPEDTDKLHVHEYDQLYVFMGADPDSVFELGAECEVTLGAEGIRRRITIPMVVTVPAGMPHFPPKVNALEKNFIFFTLSVSPKPEASVVDEKAVQGEGKWMDFWDPNGKYFNYISFSKRDDYHYGSEEPKKTGGMRTLIEKSVCGLDIVVGWQVIGNPHQLGPRRADGLYHAHRHEDYDEGLFFLSLDQEDPETLHGEADFCLGFDGEGGNQEHFTVSTSTCMAMCRQAWHLPLVFTKVEKPFLYFTISNHALA